MNYNQLVENIKKKNSYLCVGLDSDINKIPKHLLKFDNPIFEFNKKIIDATNLYTIAYKPNTAFYECMGVEGWKNLELTINYIKKNYPDIFIISDAKRGDIGNTSKMYANAFFKKLNSDAITIAPYMGEDSITPFLNYKDKWVIILALTSNKGAFDFQFIKDKDEFLFEKVINKCNKLADHNNIMYVVGATKAEKLKEIRKIAPKNFLLIPGVGAQGGTIEEVAKYGLNENIGLIVNSSRGIIYADNSINFDKSAKEIAYILQQKMQKTLTNL